MEKKSALEDLSAQEVEFVKLYAARHVNRMPRYKIYNAAFNVEKNINCASTYAWRLLKEDRIRAAVAELTGEVFSDAVAGIEEIKEHLTSVMRGAASVMGDCVSWRISPVEDKDGHYEHIATVDDPDDIPHDLRQLVERYELLSDGAYRVVFYPDALMREKLKAVEILAKMQGGFVERVELSGRDGGAIVTREMTQEEATELYRKNLNAVG